MIYLKHYLEILKLANEVINMQKSYGQKDTDSNLNARRIYETAFNGLINQGIPNREAGDEIVIETDGLIFRLDRAKVQNKSMFSMIYNEDKVVEAPIGEKYKTSTRGLYEEKDGIEEYEEDSYKDLDNENSLEAVIDMSTKSKTPMEENEEDIEDILDNSDINETDDIENIEDIDYDEPVESFEDAYEEEINQQEGEAEEENAAEEEIFDLEDFEEPTDMFNAPEENFDEEVFEEEAAEIEEMEPESIEEEAPEEAIPKEAKKQEKKEIIKENIEKREQDNKKTLEPIDHLNKSGFIMSHMSTLYEGPNGKDKIEIISAPLYPEKEDSPQIACVVINKKFKTIASNEDDTDISIVLDNRASAIIKFNKTDGKYDPIVKLDEEYDDRKITVLSKKNIGDVGHIQAYDETNNTEVHIVPINFSNSKKSGRANYIYYINVDGEVHIGDTILNPEVVFDNNGNIVNITCIWDDNEDLYMRIS